MRRTGFTLVELLVVIGIIAMLVGIIAPFLGDARETARRAVCRKNMHSVGEAMNLYATEFKMFPALYTDPPYENASIVGSHVTDHDYARKGNSVNMYVLVRRDSISDKAFICPSTDHEVNVNANPATDDDFRSYRNLSYSMHVQRREPSSAGEWRPLRITSDSDMALVADRTPISGESTWTVLSGDGGTQSDPSADGDEGGLDEGESNSFNHDREGQNVLYRDGHVLWRTSPNAGLNGDNMWTWSDGAVASSTAARLGQAFRLTCPGTRRDSLLFP